MSATTLKRGAIPTPRSTLAAAVPYVPLIGAPTTFMMKPHQISMWGNDVHGDCVTAEEAFAKACNNPEVFVSDAEVISWATSHGVLEGAYLTDVMTWMQNGGFPEGPVTYDDGPYSSVNWTDAAALQSAISRGPVKLGIAADQLENAYWSNGGQTGWFGTGFHNDQNEDHCVSLCGYGPMSWLAQQLGVSVPAGVNGSQPGYALFTWDSIGIIDVPSMRAITQEAWLRQPTTVPKSASGWHRNDLTADTGAPAATAEPCSYVFAAQKTQHVDYRGADGHIHELWWNSQGWHHADLTAAASAPGAAGAPSGYVFDSQGTQHVDYLGTDGHIHELWCDSHGWHHNDLTAAAGAPAASAGPCSYVFSAQGTQHVDYRGTDGHIHELWCDSHGWHHVDLTAAAGAPGAAGAPSGYVFDSQGTQHVDYLGSDDHIHELWWDSHGWHHADLTADTGAAAGAAGPRSYVFATQATQHVDYRGTDNHIHELWWS